MPLNTTTGYGIAECVNDPSMIWQPSVKPFVALPKGPAKIPAEGHFRTLLLNQHFACSINVKQTRGDVRIRPVIAAANPLKTIDHTSQAIQGISNG